MTDSGQRRIWQCCTHHTLPSRSATGCHLRWDSVWLWDVGWVAKCYQVAKDRGSTTAHQVQGHQPHDTEHDVASFTAVLASSLAKRSVMQFLFRKWLNLCLMATDMQRPLCCYSGLLLMQVAAELGDWRATRPGASLVCAALPLCPPPLLPLLSPPDPHHPSPWLRFSDFTCGLFLPYIIILFSHWTESISNFLIYLEFWV